MEGEPDFEMPNTLLMEIGISVRLFEARDMLLLFAHAQGGVVISAYVCGT